KGTPMSVWDDPELRVGGDFVKFENVGDSIAGTVTAVRAHKFDDGKVVPQVLLVTDDGEERTMTAGQVRLKAALAEQRPEVGDHLSVSLIDVEKRAGGKTLKTCNVHVDRDGGQQPTPQPAAVAAPNPAAAPDVAAALANLTAEQKAALGIS